MLKHLRDITGTQFLSTRGAARPQPGCAFLGHRGLACLAVLAGGHLALQADVVHLRVTVTNEAPESGAYLTPFWVGFHDGGFDSHDAGSASSEGIERLAEDGNPSALSQSFRSSGGGGADGVLDDIGPIPPGASVSKTFSLDPNAPGSRFFSYAAMVIPSNDGFVANDDPETYRIFDGAGQFVGGEFAVLGSEIKDAGTEVNDELPANTAFFGQETPDTGEDEAGVVSAHAGFKNPGAGGVLDDPMFAAADFTADGYQVASLRFELLPPRPAQVSLTIVNSAPANGLYLTPVWVGFHDGSFDLFNLGEATSASLERLAEDGNTGPLSEVFLAADGAGFDTTVASSQGIPPFAPGESATVTFTLDGNNPNHQYLSFASMVIPSNDAFVANEDPRAYRLFDDEGNVVVNTVLRLGGDVRDAGTEVNDELPANTAFFGQETPDTGEDEVGVVGAHAGFKNPGAGGVLDDPMFAAADFTADGYQVASLRFELLPPRPAQVSLTIVNSAPANGLYLTPVWVGFHDGSFDLFNLGEATSASLERLAEDGNTGPLSEVFLAADGAGFDTTVASSQGIPPFAPGESATVTFTLDGNNPNHQYLSFASMVIPSNDAFVANEDPRAYRLFDDEGNVVVNTVLRLGGEVRDAGTEVNDELPANTAFFGQETPDTGEDEAGVVNAHAGFKRPGTGGVLDDPMFAGADFIAAGYELLRMDVYRPMAITGLSLTNALISIGWDGGFPPFQVQRTASLQPVAWEDLGGPTGERFSEVAAGGERPFFRVLSGAETAPQMASYEVTFEAYWSAETHPVEFPPGPHFSGLVGATHSESTRFWEPGAEASPGIEVMAETGGKSPLENEVQAAVDSSLAGTLLSGGGIGSSPGQASLSFSISQEFPLVTLVSMIAPSPDWFVGVHGLPLFEGGRWAEELTVELQPYDAGTDNGTSFTSPNADADPQGVITRIEGFPFDVGGSVPPLGVFRFRRTD